jgi:DNA-binding response OmpR family regulator
MADLKILKSKKVLYVEDDRILSENILSIFELFFDDITSASNGLDAMNLIKINSYDIAILDIRLGDFNGLEIASKIRERNDNTLIIITSNYQEFDDLRKSIQLGVTDYLTKPFDFNELKKVLEKCVEIFEKTSQKKEFLSFDLYYDWVNKQILNYFETFNLTKNEIAFLELLLKNRGKFLGYKEINLHLYNDKTSIAAAQSGIKNIVFRLKKKIKYDIFENIAGVGYCVK